MIVYESDLKKKAIEAMQNCISYLNAGNMMYAHRFFGEACAYDEMLLDEGIDLEDKSEYFKTMKDIYRETSKQAERSEQ